MVLNQPNEPLYLRQLPIPQPKAGQILLRMRACGVCRTDLHIVDGELPNPKRSLILGHEIVGAVVQVGDIDHIVWLMTTLPIRGYVALVVCGGIHMSDIPQFPYHLLWHERIVRSVANLTRHDCEEFLALAAQMPITTEVQTFALEEANEALARLCQGEIQGAAVMVMA